MHGVVSPAGHDPDGYRMIGVDVPSRDEGPVASRQIDQATGGLAQLARPQCLPVDPGMAELNATGDVLGDAVHAPAHRHSGRGARKLRQRRPRRSARCGATGGTRVLMGHRWYTWQEGALMVRLLYLGRSRQP